MKRQSMSSLQCNAQKGEKENPPSVLFTAELSHLSNSTFRGPGVVMTASDRACQGLRGLKVEGVPLSSFLIVEEAEAQRGSLSVQGSAMDSAGEEAGSLPPTFLSCCASGAEHRLSPVCILPVQLLWESPTDLQIVKSNEFPHISPLVSSPNLGKSCVSWVFAGAWDFGKEPRRKSQLRSLQDRVL